MVGRLGTFALAKEIVGELTDRLCHHSREDLRNIFSVFVIGSYARGDFQENNSDLDIAVLFKPDGDKAYMDDPSYKLVQSKVEDIMGGRSFPSHTPGGIEWEPIRWNWLPTPENGPSFPGPGPYYPPFGIFLFDLHKHLKMCWGEDPRPHMVSPPDPASMAKAWYERFLDLPVSRGRERAASVAFKSILLAQIIFGELTLNKRRLPRLYSDFVPDFPMKSDGTRLIEEILGARYPHNPPLFMSANHYRELVAQLWETVQDKGDLERFPQLM